MSMELCNGVLFLRTMLKIKWTLQDKLCINRKRRWVEKGLCNYISSFVALTIFCRKLKISIHVGWTRHRKNLLCFFCCQLCINPRQDYKDIITTWCSDLKALFHFSYGQASINIHSFELGFARRKVIMAYYTPKYLSAIVEKVRGLALYDLYTGHKGHCSTMAVFLNIQSVSIFFLTFINF